MAPLSLLACIGLAVPATPAPAVAPRTAEAVEAALASARTALQVPGLTAAAALGTDVVFASGLGLANVEDSVRATTDTVYRIASLAKPITATAVMQLVEAGRLDLDAPVQRYVPAFPEKPWRVTPRLLLAHQGGVRHLARNEWGSARHYASLDEALECFKDDPLAYEPGTRSLYSTYGYNLLGSVVEGASGQPYADYVRERIFDPAGMAMTRVDDARALVPNRARGYVLRPSGALETSVFADTSNKVPGGGLVSTASDMARFGAALEAGSLLRPGTFTAMLVPQRTRTGAPTVYGLGFRVGVWNGRAEAWQHGGQPQVSTLLYLWPERKLTVAILCNLEGVAPALLDLAREVSVLLAPPTLTSPGKGR